MMKERSVLVIGLDGGSFNILNPMIERGIMPHLASIISKASYGDLRSTIPPITAPAWSSLRTGMNPGKHGIYGFTKPVFTRNDRGRIEDAGVGINDASSVGGVKIWNILSEMGKKVGIVSMPFTYPPEPVNGVMVSGLMTIGKSKGATHPQGLKQEIIDKSGVSFDRSIADGMSITKEFLRHLIRSVEEKNRMDLYLLRTYTFDFFMTVYQQTDTLQHYFMRFIDASHPGYDAKKAANFEPLINKFYQTIDGSIARLLGYCNDDTTVLLVSDHGFAPSSRMFYVNKYLQDKGLLRVKSQKVSALAKAGFSKRRILSILSRLDLLNLKRLLSLKARKAIKNRFLMIRSLSINYEKSIAFFNCNNEQGIYFLDHQDDDLKGKNSELKERLIAKLKSLKDPATGDRIIRNVYKREELYHGRFLDRAPDILIQTNAPWIPVSDINVSRLFESKHEGFTSGQHSLDGIFIAKGPGIKRNFSVNDANITDIMSTILYLFDLPIPDTVDGKVLKEIFCEERLKESAARRYESKYNREPSPEPGEDGSVYSRKEEEEIKKRLSELGYI
ncbi:alkaline phosphatase family protein [Candidatus Omnitrophota bacterium]